MTAPAVGTALGCSVAQREMVLLTAGSLVGLPLRSEERMADTKFLTAEEVSERYRGEITVGTLRNWRAMRIGPPFVKIGKAVLYPVAELDVWDQKIP